MNNDLISREALKRVACVKFYTTPYYKHILDLIDNAPTVNDCPKCTYKKEYDYISSSSSYKELQALRKFKKENERPQGYWEKINHGDYENLDLAIRCSECLEEVDEESNYCPYCGADMRGDT